MWGHTEVLWRRLTWALNLKLGPWNWKLELEAPQSLASSFYTLSILTSMSSSEIPYIIGMSPHDTLMMSWSVLMGMSAHVPGQLSRSSHSEQRHWSRCSSPSFLGERNGGLRHIPWHIYTLWMHYSYKLSTTNIYYIPVLRTHKIIIVIAMVSTGALLPLLLVGCITFTGRLLNLISSYNV